MPQGNVSIGTRLREAGLRTAGPRQAVLGWRAELRTGDDLHHLGCRVFGRIDDVERVAGFQLCFIQGRDRGFDEAEAVLWGICVDCSSAAAPSATSPSTDPPTTRRHGNDRD
ncbi:MAG: hypothetical protein GEU98_05475 [Pseudonocardiaceae bacterium]|nr:hypothetical protein [Pseudonocardiaceae bacterium]